MNSAPSGNASTPTPRRVLIRARATSVAAVKKMDFKKELKHLYQPSAKEVVQVDVPTFRFLMIDGEGDPNTSPAYVAAVETLFSVSHATKFMVRKGPLAVDYSVMPLEGLWWAFGGPRRRPPSSPATESKWKWTTMIVQPDFVEAPVIRAAIGEVGRKKPRLPVDKLRLEDFAGGLCAQVLHVGPFAAEGPTVRRVHDFIEARSALAGKHHEIYLSDIRRADPSRWRTVVRQPMA